MKTHALRAVAALLLLAGLVRAIETQYVADYATLIVVGTLSPGFTFPWFDGWHLLGTITVDEVLYGPRQSDQIKFRFVCCAGQYWPPPRYTRQLNEKGLWFLRPVDEQTWESSDGPWHIGFRSLSERESFENYIRSYKH